MSVAWERGPEVHPAGDVVVLEVAPRDAQILARALARFDATHDPDLVPGYDSETWVRVVVRLLAAAAQLGATDEEVAVPLVRHPVYFSPDQWADAIATAGSDR